MKALIKTIKEQFDVGTVMVERRIRQYEHRFDGSYDTSWVVTVFVTDDDLIFEEAPTIKALRRKIIAELNERGLNK